MANTVVEVDPRVAGKVLRGDGSGEQRVVVPGDDTGSHVEEARAPQESRQRQVRDRFPCRFVAFRQGPVLSGNGGIDCGCGS